MMKQHEEEEEEGSGKSSLIGQGPTSLDSEAVFNLVGYFISLIHSFLI